ncbi:hypothetical protein AgCh_005769 [Apium graveolens]
MTGIFGFKSDGASFSQNISIQAVRNDLLDGNQVQLLCTKWASTCLLNQLGEPLWLPIEFYLVTGKLSGYLLWRIEDSTFKFRLQEKKQFVSLDNDDRAVVTKSADDTIA